MTAPDRHLLTGAEALAEAARRLGRGPVVAAGAPPLEDLGRVARGAGVSASQDAEAAGLAYGAAAAGAVPLLAVSGAGLGRVAEVVSAACASELPMVIAACPRGGPGGGNDCPTQSDYVLATRAPGPGGAALPVFAPAGVQEVLDLYPEAVALAEAERTPVLVLLDALVARSREAVTLPPEYSPPEAGPNPIVDGAVLGAAPKDKGALEALGFRLGDKARGWREKARAEELACEDADWILVAYGSPARVARTAVEKARKRGLALGLFRPVTLRPFPDEALAARLVGKKGALALELSEGQLLGDVRRVAPPEVPVHFYGRMGGAVPTPFEVMHHVQALAEAQGAP